MRKGLKLIEAKTREQSVLECDNCYEQIEQCSMCGEDFTKEGEDIYCEHNGSDHYCEACEKEINGKEQSEGKEK